MDKYLEELYLTGNSSKYRDVSRNKALRDGFVRAVNAMISAENIEELKKISYLHYELLKYQYSGMSSVRLSNSFVHRLLFRETKDGLEVTLIEIDDTHYGNK